MLCNAAFSLPNKPYKPFLKIGFGNYFINEQDFALKHGSSFLPSAIIQNGIYTTNNLSIFIEYSLKYKRGTSSFSPYKNYNSQVALNFVSLGPRYRIFNGKFIQANISIALTIIDTYEYFSSKVTDFGDFSYFGSGFSGGYTALSFETNNVALF